MSTDSQGRPLSDDGQWAWNGTEWVPAAGGPAEPAATDAAAEAPVQDAGATMIVQSPFPGGVQSVTPPGDAAPYGSAQAGYGQAPGSAPSPAYGQPPAYGQAPGYGPSAPGGFGAPPAAKSRKPLLLAVIGVLVIAAVVVVLIVALGGSTKKTVKGAYTCRAPGSAGTGVITFNSGGKYALNNGGTGGSYTAKGDTVTFQGGTLDKINATVSDGAKTVKLTYRGSLLTCKK